MQEKLFDRLMDVIEYDVTPLTRKRVSIGCKVFGAAVLRKDDLSLVLAETNMEAFSPLWHGEVYAIKQFWELQGHPDPRTASSSPRISLLHVCVGHRVERLPRTVLPVRLREHEQGL